MLVYIDQGVLEETETISVSEIEVLCECLRAHRNGIHTVVMERETASRLRHMSQISEIDRATLARMENEFTQYGGMLHDAPFYIRLISPNCRTAPVKKSGEIVYPLSAAQELKQLLERPIVVVEDISNDGGIFRIYFELLSTDLPGLAYEVRHSGGCGRLPVVTKDALKSGRIVVAVIDSERRTPYCVPSKPADKLFSLSSGGSSLPPFFPILLPVRETENLIPADVCQLLDPRRPPHAPHPSVVIAQVVERQRQAGTFGEHEFWMYFDYKKGFIYEKYKDLTDDARVYLDSVRSHLDEIGIQLVHGFSDRLIPLLLGSDAARAQLRAAATTEPYASLLRRLFGDVVWLFVAPRPRVT